MNNLHRSLAPISDAAWEQIEEEARRTFRLNAAARRVVDMPEPAGTAFAAVGTGHLESVDSPAPGVSAYRREVRPVIELRVPFRVTRSAVDDVDRGSTDSDWQPVKDAAAKIATAEDRTVFLGASGIAGIAPGSSNAPVALPESVQDYPDALAQALTELRLARVTGPFNLLLSAKVFTAVAETTDHGYPVYDHLKRLLRDGRIVWAPALEGALVVSGRGGTTSCASARTSRSATPRTTPRGSTSTSPRASRSCSTPRRRASSSPTDARLLADGGRWGQPHLAAIAVMTRALRFVAGPAWRSTRVFVSLARW